MTKRIWKWLKDLPDEYEHHDHTHAVPLAEHKAEAWDGRSGPTADRTMKRCFDARRTRQKDVDIIDLTGDHTDVKGTTDEDERQRKKHRARLGPAERADAVALISGRKGIGRTRKGGAKGAAGATATRVLKGDTVRRGALRSVC